jgi:hypothetical protein
MEPFLSQGAVIATSVVAPAVVALAPNVTADPNQVVNLSFVHEAEYLI